MIGFLRIVVFVHNVVEYLNNVIQFFLLQTDDEIIFLKVETSNIAEVGVVPLPIR